MDVPPDELDKLKEHNLLAINKRRLAFYKRYGARPIINTHYDRIVNKANQGFFTFLVYDDLDTGMPLRRKELAKIITRLLAIKAKTHKDEPILKKIIDSIQDDPIQLRVPVYTKGAGIGKSFQQTIDFEIVNAGDAEQIHHLKERGYVERPARVKALVKGLQGFRYNEQKIKSFGEKHISAIHDPKLIAFLKQAEKELKPGQLLYPNIFPVRRAERIPKTWDVRAGYYCIDTFTPVTSNVYKAARNAVDAALTGAERVLKGAPVCYVLCRPPGHHAERRAFGGFCYFNNAAIAANYLSAHGKVGFIDLDYHHGNGSQDIFYKRKDVYFVSIHGHPCQAYPYFAGYEDEKGEDEGKCFNRNYPLYPGMTDESYCKTLTLALKTLKSYKPDFLVVSQGYDIMAGDPTGSFNGTTHGMKQIGEQLRALKMPLLIVQEGGYSLRNLRSGTTAFFQGILS